MKLNIDCIRDLLLFIERDATLGGRLTLSDIQTALPDYSEDEIVYTALKLEEAGFIRCSTSNVRKLHYLLVIQELTYSGHQFLEDIRSDSVWDKVKSVSGSVGSASLNVLSEIAAKVVSSLIQSQIP